MADELWSLTKIVPKYTLVYFDIRGLAETIRLLFIDNGVEFQEEAIAFDKWKDVKPTMRFGQVPCLKVDGEEMVQSNAILRYLAKSHGLYGSDPKSQYQIDMWNDGVDDVKKKYIEMIYRNYDQGKGAYIESIPSLLAPFEKHLGSNKFLAGDKISFADYNFFNLVDFHEILAPGTLAKVPAIKAYFQRIADRPKIAEYRKTDLFQTRPVNGNGKQ